MSLPKQDLLTWLSAWTSAFLARWPNNRPGADTRLVEEVLLKLRNDLPFATPPEDASLAALAWSIAHVEGDTEIGRAAVALACIASTRWS